MLIGLICPSQQTQDLQDLKFCYFLKVKPQLGSPTMTDQTLALQVTSLDQQHQPHPGLVRRAPSRAPAQICCIRTAGGGARQSVLTSPPPGAQALKRKALTHVQVFAIPWTEEPVHGILQARMLGVR